jgi:hypothetical protein
MQLRS